MAKSVMMPAAGIALAVAAFLLLLPRGDEAAAQTAALYISAVDLEISPASMPKFLAALQDDGAAMIKEPDAREFDSTVSQKDAGHLFVFEVYNSAAAYDAHQKTAAYGKFIAATMAMIKTYNIRPFTAVAMNTNSGSRAAPGPFFVNQVELDIVPEQFDAFMSAAKDNAAASVKDDGCREFDIAVLEGQPHHVMILEVYDNATALDAHRATDHYKTYQATTKDMVAKRNVTALSSVSMLAKTQ
jgi:autoinducer 2-degrading protein